MESFATDAPSSFAHDLGLSPGAGAEVDQAADPEEPPASESDSSFWEKHRGLVWSNRNASNAVRIRAALLRPLFPVLLDIAARYGLERLEHEWAILKGDAGTDTLRAEPIVRRILTNIRRGYEQART